MATAPNGNELSIRIRVGGLYLRNNKILLVRHEKDNQSYWLLPGGGVEPGETMASALEREALEECGIVTKTERLLFVSEAISCPLGRHHVNVTFLGRITEGEPYLREKGARIVEVAWLSREELESIRLFPDFWPILRQAIDSGFENPCGYLGNLWRDS